MTTTLAPSDTPADQKTRKPSLAHLADDSDPRNQPRFTVALCGSPIKGEAATATDEKCVVCTALWSQMRRWDGR